jgi:hypothetical protein
MPIPTQQRLFHKYYTVFARSLAAADSPSFAVSGRGRVVDMRVDVLVSPTTNPTVITPKINTIQMQLNGANTTMSIAAGATANTVAASLQPNGLNVVDQGDVITLTSDGGAANASSVPAYYTVTVDERSL